MAIITILRVSSTSFKSDLSNVFGSRIFFSKTPGQRNKSSEFNGAESDKLEFIFSEASTIFFNRS